MSDTRLLVPMQVDAMVLSQDSSLTTPFLRFQMQYANLQSFTSAEPAPFSGGSANTPAAGIYLHWTLPRALRHGRPGEGGGTVFPLAPNRWLVVRVQGGAGGGAVKAWVLESDYVGADGATPYVDPTGFNQYGTPNPVQVGRALRFDPSLKAIAPQPHPFLRATGPGSVTFAAFAPGVENVFAFTDPVTADDDATPIAAGTFSYHVTGWYADPSYDPLRATKWAEDGANPGAWLNDTFDWTVYAASTPPAVSLVHALVSGVAWDRDADTPPAANFPRDLPQTVKVAVGNTAIDALAAIVRLEQGSETEADLLEAFQYGLLETLDEPGSAEALNAAMRDHWFGASPAGTGWTVVPRERTGNTALPAPPPPVLTGAQATALAALNVAQRELDRQRRILDSMQWTLYALWWKTQWQLYTNPPMDGNYATWLATQLPLQTGGAACTDPSGTDPDAEPWYLCKVNAQRNRVSALATAAGGARAALDAILGPAQESKAVELPQYRAASDPVIVVTGLGRSTVLDPAGTLLCRLASQTVDALTVAGADYCASGSCAHPVAVPPLAGPAALLPDGVQALHTESFFLSPALFAQDAMGTAADAPRVSAAIAALPRPAAGTRFPPRADAMPEWVQPWVPLLLDWQVAVLNAPAYTAGASEWQMDPAQWTFDGSDFQWTGPTQATGTDFNEGGSEQMTLTGRTFITPHISHALAGQLAEWIAKHKMRDPALEKQLEALEAYLVQIRAQDVVSQRLSGMTAMMAERALTSMVPPTGAVAAALEGHAPHGYPLPFPDLHASYAAPVWDFAPMSGTFFVVQKLTVIDTQGRTVDLMLGNHSTDPLTQGSVTEYYFYPIAGRGMKAPTTVDPVPGIPESTEATQRMLQLPPRPIQDAQLALRFTANDGSDAEVGLAAGANPVCGWIVPNHLDRSLALYAPDGSAWGEVYLSLQAGGSYLPAWSPDPTNPHAPAHVADIPNRYVREMFEALWARTDHGAAFDDFMRVIDETLWTVNPRGQRQDQDLSVLVGRPLAVVRAELSLRLSGVARVSQDWWNTFDVNPSPLPDPTLPAPLGAVDGGVAGPRWPVRVGSLALRDDGVVGYYLDPPAGAGFTAFNALEMPDGMRTDYLRRIGGDGGFIRLRFTDDMVAAPDPHAGQAARLTLLADPRGSVHAFSGLLPVVSASIPDEFVTPALERIAYLFRAGPFLTAPDAVRIPRPSERAGSWAWFDHVAGATTPVAQADGAVRFPSTPPLVREGWLKFTPNEPDA